VSKPRTFKVINGTPPPDALKEAQRKRRLANPDKPAHLIRCNVCSGTALIQIRLGVELYCGKPRGGQKHMICVQCFSQGRTVLLY
jgi:hypothetical protein